MDANEVRDFFALQSCNEEINSKPDLPNFGGNKNTE